MTSTGLQISGLGRAQKVSCRDFVGTKPSRYPGAVVWQNDIKTKP